MLRVNRATAIEEPYLCKPSINESKTSHWKRSLRGKQVNVLPRKQTATVVISLACLTIFFEWIVFARRFLQETSLPPLENVNVPSAKVRKSKSSSVYGYPQAVDRQHAIKKDDGEDFSKQYHASNEQNLSGYNRHHNEIGGHKKLVKKLHKEKNFVPSDRHCDFASVLESEVGGIEQCAFAFEFPKTAEPEEGWLHEIDFYFFRPQHKIFAHCFVRCLEMILDRGEIEVDSEWLIDAAKFGIPEVIETLLNNTDLDLDPLYSTGGGDLNAVQVAIRGGYAKLVKLLINSDTDLVIDKHGRTVHDYVNLKGSPILPADAENILGITVQLPEDSRVTQRQVSKAHYNDENSGWSHETSYYFDDSKCDIDILYNLSRDDFFKNYFLPGRPFVLRNLVPRDELAAFTRDRWDSTEDYDIHKRNWRVGPTAYPDITNQDYCERKMTILELEASKECKEMPGIPMEVAWHPEEEDFEKLWPMYKGEEFYKKSGWRKMEEWFGPRGEYGDQMAWQVFFGGDGSGATFHWHGAAFNNLYVGTKQWRITPPYYRGFTGMPAKDAKKYLDEKERDVTMGCVQHAGDMMYIPESWGHLTLTHGFTIGSAVIMPKEYHRPRDIPFLFVHINKTGGTSIIERFQDRCGEEWFEESWGDDHRTFHTTAQSFINRYGREVWDKAYTFTVVRHPLARQVSNFFFLAGRCKSNPQICRDRLIPKEVRGNKMLALSDEEKIVAFHKWVNLLYEAYPPGSEEQYFFGSRSQGNQENKSFNATQTSWLVDNNDKIVVNDIYQLESIDEHMDKLTDAIPCLKEESDSKSKDLGETGRGKAVEFSHKNVTPKYPDWKLFAQNERTRKIINQVYDVDFRNFGYEWP